ncbi:MAG: helix-turn-helix domain-containing protein [Phycisphaeraceae bacterium]
MPDSHPMQDALTPPQVAEALGVNPTKIIDFIRSGELRAVNLARRESRRPRWRILRTDLETFIAGRSSQRPMPAKRVRRRDMTAPDRY